MKQDILNYIINNAGSLSVEEVLVNFAAALIVGFVIFLSYRFCHASAAYSARFNVSLWMLTVVTTMVMCVIGNNIALSLGMVGALSIVRFRTAIKDTRDTVYIFWCIAAGICCGISDFTIATIGSTIIFLLMLVIGNTQENNRFLLIIRGNDAMTDAVELTMRSTYAGKARLCVKNTGHGSAEYIYELSRKMLKQYEDSNSITNRLLKLEHVEEVSLVAQNDEITA